MYISIHYTQLQLSTFRLCLINTVCITDDIKMMMMIMLMIKMMMIMLMVKLCVCDDDDDDDDVWCVSDQLSSA